MLCRRRFIWVAIWTLSGSATLLLGEPAGTQPASRSADATTRPFITMREGTMPVILSAPHGGTRAIPGVPVRTGVGVPKTRGAAVVFTFAFDRGTDRLALRVAEEIEKRCGRRPYVVVANFSRKYLDANRPPAEAYEDERARAVYDEYHGALRRFREEILARYGRGLLLDLHLQGRDPKLLIRGTGHWRSVGHLVEEFGKGALTGEEGLLGPIAAAGFELNPANGADDEREAAGLSGGYITLHYGSEAGGKFDAVQLEHGGNYVTRAGMERYAPVLAEAVVGFSGRYLKGEGAGTRPASR